MDSLEAERRENYSKLRQGVGRQTKGVSMHIFGQRERWTVFKHFICSYNVRLQFLRSHRNMTCMTK
jgi:hypothetical protein